MWKWIKAIMFVVGIISLIILTLHFVECCFYPVVITLAIISAIVAFVAAVCAIREVL